MCASETGLQVAELIRVSKLVQIEGDIGGEVDGVDCFSIFFLVILGTKIRSLDIIS